jgi:hypothetical protein
MVSSRSESLEEGNINFLVELISSNTYGYCFSHCIGILDLKGQLMMEIFYFLIYFVVNNEHRSLYSYH